MSLVDWSRCTLAIIGITWTASPLMAVGTFWVVRHFGGFAPLVLIFAVGVIALIGWLSIEFIAHRKRGAGQ